jgi:phage recombination protein Bet
MDDLATTRGNGSALAPAQAPGWTREQMDLIKRTCVPAGDAPSDDAFAVFLHVCQRTGLDPMLREAWLISRRSKTPRGDWITTWQTMAGRDGYLAAAHRTGEFRGIQTETWPADKRQAPTHATCTVWRAGWAAPVICTVAFAEYAADSPLWRGKPHTMIAKVAESHALRRAFSLHGTYTPEEMPDDAPAPRPLAEVLPRVDRPAELREAVHAKREQGERAALPPAIEPADEMPAWAAPAPEAQEEPVPAPPAEQKAPRPADGPRSATAAAVFARMNAATWSKDDQIEFCRRHTGKESRKEYVAADWLKVHRALDESEREQAKDATP